MSAESLQTEQATTRSSIAVVLTTLAGAIAVLMRVYPHPANLLPIGAMGIFGGAKLRGVKAYLFPLGIMVVSDVALWARAGFDPKYLFHASRIYVYGSFLIYVAIGRLLKGRESPAKLCAASLLGSLQFFLITNFCVWLLQPLESMEGVPAAYIYSRDLAGVLQCFLVAVPFFQGDSPLSLHAIMVGDPKFGAIYLVVGDLLFTFGLFVLNAALVRKILPAETRALELAVQTASK
jgi:hypothetical protein